MALYHSCDKFRYNVNIIVHHLSRKVRIGVNVLLYILCVLFIDQTANHLKLDRLIYQYLKTIAFCFAASQVNSYGHDGQFT